MSDANAKPSNVKPVVNILEDAVSMPLYPARMRLYIYDSALNSVTARHTPVDRCLFGPEFCSQA